MKDDQLAYELLLAKYMKQINIFDELEIFGYKWMTLNNFKVKKEIMLEAFSKNIAPLETELYQKYFENKN